LRNGECPPSDTAHIFESPKLHVLQQPIFAWITREQRLVTGDPGNFVRQTHGDLHRSDFTNANNKVKVAEGGVHQPQSELCGKVGVLSYRNAKERRMAAKFKVRADVFHYFVMVVVGSGGAYAFTRLYGESDEVKESNLVRHVVHFPS